MSGADTMYMRRAVMLAGGGWGQTSPNPMVGAVVVREGEIVGEGFHARYGGEHAEPVALHAAGARARDATMFVTLEPCAHYGQRPPCAPAIIAAGIRRVVIAARDPNPVAAGGAAVLRTAGIDVEFGVEEAEARELNAAFFHRFTSDRPFTALKLALSIDGKIGDAARSSGWLTGEESRREVHRQRAGFAGISAGIGTVIADDPLLTVRGRDQPRVPPTRVIFDRAAQLPLESSIMRSISDAPVIVATDGSAPQREQALARAGARIVRAAGTAETLRALRSEGIESLYVEGGAGLAGALMEADVVDRLIIFRAPVMLGAGALGGFDRAPSYSLAEAPRWRTIRQERFADDDMTIYARD